MGDPWKTWKDAGYTKCLFGRPDNMMWSPAMGNGIFIHEKMEQHVDLKNAVVLQLSPVVLEKKSFRRIEYAPFIERRCAVVLPFRGVSGQEENADDEFPNVLVLAHLDVHDMATRREGESTSDARQRRTHKIAAERQADELTKLLKAKFPNKNIVWAGDMNSVDVTKLKDDYVKVLDDCRPGKSEIACGPIETLTSSTDMTQRRGGHLTAGNLVSVWSNTAVDHAGVRGFDDAIASALPIAGSDRVPLVIGQGRSSAPWARRSVVNMRGKLRGTLDHGAGQPPTCAFPTSDMIYVHKLRRRALQQQQCRNQFARTQAKCPAASQRHSRSVAPLANSYGEGRTTRAHRLCAPRRKLGNRTWNSYLQGFGLPCL